MKRMFCVFQRYVLAVTAILMIVASTHAHAVTIDWVTVGDAGNAADTTTYGAVADAFQIMKFEWTNSQYVEFLNAVDPNGTNPNAIYDTSMGSNARGGISFDANASAGSKYDPKPNMGDKPVNYVSWWDAARVANWLQNGQGTGSTETGAYTLNNATSGTFPAVNFGAQFYIPTENQWYKAAYYKGGSTNAGYWDYATQSDTAPTAVTAGSTGIGSAGGTGNFANYLRATDWNGQDGNVTTVGTNGGPSAYGTFDMSGNLAEMNSLTVAASSFHGGRGGDWYIQRNSSFLLSSSNRSDGGTGFESDKLGFRLASPAAVPEPSTCAVGLAGIACAGWGTYRRRRAR
jgi:sulfatase modifying factor 1